MWLFLQLLTSLVNSQLPMQTDEDKRQIQIAKEQYRRQKWKEGKHAKAIIHIGPHKTGTTHVQALLAKHMADLHRVNYDFPAAVYNPRLDTYSYDFHVQKYFIRELNGESEHNTLKTFVEKSYRMSKNIIISSENFIGLSLNATQNLKDALSRYDSFRVFALYRDQLTRIRSRRYEHTEHLEMKETPFMQYLEQKFQYYIDEFTTAIDNYVSVFGEKAVRILDYEGVLAANKDQTYVMFCERMGIMCEQLKDAVAQNHANVSPDFKQMHPRLFLDYVEERFVKKGCEPFSMAQGSRVLEITEQWLRNLTDPVPTRVYPLDDYMQRSREDERNVRKRFKELFIYPNPAACEIARAGLKHEEPDFSAMESNITWSTALRRLEQLSSHECTKLE